MQLAGKALIEHVMDNCIKASDYLNRNFNRYSTTVNTAMLIPGGDKLGDKYGDKYRVFDFQTHRNGTFCLATTTPSDLKTPIT